MNVLINGIEFAKTGTHGCRWVATHWMDESYMSMMTDSACDQIAELRAEVSRLSAENARLRAEVDSLRSDLSAARAALDGEREALSTAQRALANISGCGGCENCGDIASAAFASIDARRAAEAQPTPVRCPECDGTGRRVKYHGGSINDPNMIGLAMESLPCRCQAAEARP